MHDGLRGRLDVPGHDQLGNYDGADVWRRLSLRVPMRRRQRVHRAMQRRFTLRAQVHDAGDVQHDRLHANDLPRRHDCLQSPLPVVGRSDWPAWGPTRRSVRT